MVNENSFFRTSQLNGKKEIHEIPIWISQVRMDFSEVKSIFGFCIRLQNVDFPIEHNLSSMYLDCCNHRNTLPATTNWTDCI